MINRDAAYLNGVKNKPLIHRSGLVKPFSSTSNLITMTNLCEKLVEIWRMDAGYSREPLILVIERPVTYPGSPVRFSAINDLSIFVGMLVRSLAPSIVLLPTPNEWKGTKKKFQTEAEIININDFHSKKALERDLSYIALDLRHNVYDALGMGLYGIDVDTNKKPLPRMYFHIHK